MKKIFKALAITATAAAMCVGIGVTAGCADKSGEYIGHYCYANEYNAVYGMVVKVTVKNNIIEKVEDVTHTYGDGKAYSCEYKPVVIDWTQGGPQRDEYGQWLRTTETVTTYNEKWHTVSDPTGDWTADNKTEWLNKENWLLQQYKGMSVADVLAIEIYFDENGEPYAQSDNAEFAESGLLISGSTQGSGRMLLAVQNALGK